MKKKRTVMTFGTFDLFHPGHRFYLSEARREGNYIITVIARDDTVSSLKGRSSREREAIRMQKVEESGLSDEVVLGSNTNYYDIISEKKPDVLFFGYDQKSFNGPELAIYLRENKLTPRIIVGEPFEPEKWKSSKL